MTPRTRVTLLVLIVTLTDPSGQNCADYFNMAKWSGQNLTCTFPMAKARHPRDLIRCTLRDACQRTAHPLFCGIQKSCFNAEDSWTCEGTSSQNISFYHLMCLAAKAKDDSIVPEGCKYESVCGLYHQLSLDRNPTTTTSSVLPTPTAPAAVCALSPTPETTSVTQTESREGDVSKDSKQKVTNTPQVILSSAGSDVISSLKDTITRSPCFTILVVVLVVVLVVLVLLALCYLRHKREERHVQPDYPLLNLSNNDATMNEDTTGDRSAAH